MSKFYKKRGKLIKIPGRVMLKWAGNPRSLLECD